MAIASASGLATVVQNRGHKKLFVGILKHHPDYPGADFGQVVFRHRQAADSNAAFPAQNALVLWNEGGLAGSIRSEKRDRFAWLPREIDVFQSLDAVLIVNAPQAAETSSRNAASWPRTPARS